MAVKLFVVIVIVSMLALGNALDCYTCMGSENGSCHKGVPSASVAQNCSVLIRHNQNIPSLMLLPTNYKDVVHCVQITYLNGPGIEKPYFQRDCAFIDENLDFCDFLAQHQPVKNCMVCDKDRCNSKPGGQF